MAVVVATAAAVFCLSECSTAAVRGANAPFRRHGSLSLCGPPPHPHWVTCSIVQPCYVCEPCPLLPWCCRDVPGLCCCHARAAKRLCVVWSCQPAAPGGPAGAGLAGRVGGSGQRGATKAGLHVRGDRQLVHGKCGLSPATCSECLAIALPLLLHVALVVSTAHTHTLLTD